MLFSDNFVDFVLCMRLYIRVHHHGEYKRLDGRDSLKRIRNKLIWLWKIGAWTLTVSAPAAYTAPAVHRTRSSNSSGEKRGSPASSKRDVNEGLYIPKVCSKDCSVRIIANIATLLPSAVWPSREAQGIEYTVDPPTLSPDVGCLHLGTSWECIVL